MANTSPLVLTLSANTGDLRKSLRDVSTDLLDFSKSTDGIMADFKASMAKGMTIDPAAMGKQLERNMSGIIATMKRQAKAAMDMGGDFNPLGGFSSAASLEAAAAQDRLATSYRNQAQAAQMATASNEQEGLVLREVMVSMERLAVESERQAASLRTQAGAYTAIEGEMLRMGAVAEEVAQQEEVLAKGHQRMGIAGMEMMHVIRATGDSFAAGMPPMMVFTEQMGRITDAVGFYAMQNEGATGGLAKFAGFMAGPWGLAVMAGTSLLGTLIARTNIMADVFGGATAKLEEDEKALKDVKFATDGVKDAQSVLAEVMDITTGKITSQSAALREMALAQLLVAKAKAETNQAEAHREVQSMQDKHYDISGGMGGGFAITPREGIEGQISKQLLHGLISAEQATQKMEAAKSGGDIDMPTYLKGIQAIANFGMESRNIDAAKAGLAMLDGTANSAQRSMILKPEKAHREKNPPKDHTQDRADSYAELMAGLDAKGDAIARGGVTDPSILALLDIEKAKADLAKQQTAIRKQGRNEEWGQPKINAALDKAALNEGAQEEAIKREESRKLAERDLQNQIDALALQDRMLKAQEVLAPTLTERAKIAKQILDNEQAIALLGVQKGQASGKVSDDQAATENTAINAEYQAKGRQSAKQNADPIQQWKNGLIAATGDMKTALQSVEADGLKGLEDGLQGIITGTESAGQAFKKMAASILADLAKIAIEKGIVAIFGLSDGGKVPGFADGGIPGFAEGGPLIPGFATGTLLSNGMISGPGTGTSDSIIAMVNGKNPIRLSNGEGVVNARAVKNYWPVIDAMNKGNFPGFADGGVPGMAGLSYPALPSVASMRQQSPAAPILTFDMRGAITTPELLQQMHQISQQYSTAALVASPDLAQAQMDQRAAQQIPS